MKYIEHAIDDAIKKHSFQRISDLSRNEFSALMTDIIKEAIHSQDMQDIIAEQIRSAKYQMH